jgi:hypothetical protein
MDETETLPASPLGPEVGWRAFVTQQVGQTLGQLRQAVSISFPPWTSEGSFDVNSRRVSLLRVSLGMDFFFMGSPHWAFSAWRAYTKKWIFTT